jgi:hypothetical protein
MIGSNFWIASPRWRRKTPTCDAGDRATLRGPPPDRDPRSAAYALTYELTLAH